MWQRTRRLITSYLDNLIDRVQGPESEVREVTREEVVRLAEVEVQSRASVKIYQKELAELELKIVGLSERERMATERGDVTTASASASAKQALTAQQDLLKKQINEDSAAADRAKALREERRRTGEDLATESTLTSMRQDVAGVHTSFDPMDPSGTIEEMRARLGGSSAPSTEELVAEADREIAAKNQLSKIEEELARYKESLNTVQASPIPQATQPKQTEQPASPGPSEEESPGQEKTLGRTDGPVRPID